MKYKLGIDTGGTFTDLVAMDEKGRLKLAKVESTPGQPSKAIHNGIELLSKEFGLGVNEFLGQCDLIIHGTTVATNALIEQNYAKTGLLCNKGFRDILEIRLLYKEERYDPYYPLPKMLVPRYLRLPIEGRITIDGKIHTPLNMDDAKKAIAKFKKEGVEAVAIAFLWSFVNPIHEERVRDMVVKEMPHAYICISSEVLPEYREYPRTSTTVLNACLGPIIYKYTQETEQLFISLGYGREVRYMQCNAGIASGDILRQKAVLALDSGPAAGPVAGLFFGRLVGYDNVITMDMGGTSFDISLISDGMIDEVKGVDVIRYRLGIPKIRVNTLGAGGGSIAWIDSGGVFRVGPQSAEAVPGPACYAKGGEDPTVTDANVVLGYFDPDFLLGGKLKIESELSKEAIHRKIASVLGLSMEEAALGIFNIVNANMVNGVREISLERGYDTRDFALVVGGGCGAAHAGRIAKEMAMPLVIIPRMASGLCAFGEVIADVKHDYSASYTTLLDDLDPNRLTQILDSLESRGYKDLASEGIGRDTSRMLRTLYIRYVGQAWECPVTIPGGQITQEMIPAIKESFHAVHERLYTFCDRATKCELITVMVTALGKGPTVEIPSLPLEGKNPIKAKKGERDAFFEEYKKYVKIPVFDGNQLKAGNVIDGPAIIEEPTTTIVVFPRSHLNLNEKNIYTMTFDT
jgi:N-methylhydantoinase A